MNRDNLNRVFDLYVENFERVNAPKPNDEGKKWRAVSHYLKHWDLEAEDFPAMFKQAIGKTYDLLDNSKEYPTSGIRTLMMQECGAEFVRERFRELYQEDGGDLDARRDRIVAFREQINAEIIRHIRNATQSTCSMKACICFLNLWKPEENYLYKYREAKLWASFIGYGDYFGMGSNLSLRKYYRMCDEIVEEAQKNDAIMALHQKRFEREARGYDDKLHLLAFDILYCASTYKYYEGLSSVDLPAVKRTHVSPKRHRISESQ